MTMAALRQSLSWMHRWTGLLFGSVLYCMFLTGAAGYFDTEINRRMRPEHPKPAAVTDPAATFEAGIAYAEATAPDAESWFVRVSLTRSDSPFVEVTWQGGEGAAGASSGRAELDLSTGLIVAAQFGTGVQGESAFYEDLYGPWPIFESAGEPADPVPISRILASAEALRPHQPIAMITVLILTYRPRLLLPLLSAALAAAVGFHLFLW